MIGDMLRSAGKIVLATTIIAGMAACGGSTSHSTAPASPAPTTSSAGPSSPAPTTSSTGTTGPNPRVAIPDVIGDDETFAKQLLASYGIERVTEDSKPNLLYNFNYATGTNPPGETEVSAGSPLTLFLSGGISSAVTGGAMTLSMPNILNLTFQQANTVLVEEGITLCPHPLTEASAKPAGLIIGSVPPAHQKFVAYGSTAARPVVVTVSSGSTTSPGSSPSAGSTNGC